LTRAWRPAAGHGCGPKTVRFFTSRASGVIRHPRESGDPAQQRRHGLDPRFRGDDVERAQTGHPKDAPCQEVWNPFWNFQPRSGACYGFMVSGLARDSVHNVTERSQVVKIQWP